MGKTQGWHFSLKPWEERNGVENRIEAVIARTTRAFSQICDGLVFPFNMLAIVELGTATGFNSELFELIAQIGLGHNALTKSRSQFLGMIA